jgi:hypothetical protein
MAIEITLTNGDKIELTGASGGARFKIEDSGVLLVERGQGKEWFSPAAWQTVTDDETRKGQATSL